MFTLKDRKRVDAFFESLTFGELKQKLKEAGGTIEPIPKGHKRRNRQIARLLFSKMVYSNLRKRLKH